jgi:hypothetical protein
MIMVGWLVMRPPILCEEKKRFIPLFFFRGVLREAHLLLKSKGWCKEVQGCQVKVCLRLLIII